MNKLKIYRLYHITPFQSAFVAGRIIQDNIMVAHEVFHYLHSRPSTKRVECALKLDMENVYDRVEWDFITQTLTRRRFPY